MDKAERMHIEEMNRLKKAMEKTNSKYLKRDYKKALVQMQKELEMYRFYKGGANA